MSGFSLPTNFVENPEKLMRSVQPRVVPPPISQSTSESAFQAPATTTEPIADFGDVNFELKSSLINMVQASPFCGKPNEDANAHLQNYLELCKTVTIRGVTADAIRLRLFPFSLLGKAKQWFYQNKEAVSTWDKHPSPNSFRWGKQMPNAEVF